MKKFIAGIVALMLGFTAAYAAFEVTLDETGAGGVASATFTYSDLDGTPTFDGGALSNATAVTDSFITGASGSLSVTWTATDVAGPINPSTWTFGTNANLFSFGTGLGIQSGVNTTNPLETTVYAQFQTDEAFLLTFNMNNLVLDPGSFLSFSVRAKDGKSFKIYQRTGSTSGTVVAEVAGATPANFSFPVYVNSIAQENGLLEFAITDFTSYGLLLDFKIDVFTIADPPPTGLTAVPRNTGALLRWDPDPTVLLDFYTVYRSLISEDLGSYVAVTNVVNNEVIDTGLTNGTTYYYMVTATSIGGEESSYSQEASVTPVALSTDTVLLARYDASVASSLSLSNGTVAAWTNQAAPGTYTATPVAPYEGVLYPSASHSSSDLAGLDFTTNNTRLQVMTGVESDLLLDTTGGKSGFVVVMALRLDGTGASQYILSNGDGFGIRAYNTRFIPWLGTAVPFPFLSTTATVGDTIVISLRYDVADLEFTAWESASGNTSAAPCDPGDYSGNILALGDDPGGVDDFEGQIFELKIWGSTLDDATLAAEQAAMVAKWVTTEYGTWAGRWNDIDIGEATNDYDNDGVLNLYEYALNGDPTNESVAPAILPAIVKTGSGLEYIHPRRNNDPTLVYDIETTTNLTTGSWTNIGVAAAATNIGGGFFDTVTNTVDSVDSEKFIRLQIQRN